jgi:hypothetical protein
VSIPDGYGRTASRLRVRRLLLGAALVCGAATIVVAARALWPTERWSAVYTPWLHHFSTDLAQVHITLRYTNDPDPRHRAALGVPAAYVVFVEGLGPKDAPRLPARFGTSQVDLAMTWPDGKPLSVHARENARRDGISFAQAATALRANHMAVSLGYVRPDIPWEARVRERNRFMAEAEPFDGLLHVTESRRDIYFGDGRSDEFVRIWCFLHADSRPDHFCTTSMRVAPDIVANVDFVDFRFNGGREFVNERIRLVRATVCQFLENRC